jgi:PPM family protein phosphatase
MGESVGPKTESFVKGGSKMHEENQKTSCQDAAETHESLPTKLPPHNIPSALVRVDLAAQSHQGFVRDNNEDHYLVVQATRSLETVLTNMNDNVFPKSFAETVYGMVVADGMGGMAAGEVASRVALLTLVELVAQTPDWIMKMNQPENAATVMRRMTLRFRQIDDELRELGETTRSLHGMGTTLTVAATLGSDVFLGHIGDSRAYLLRGEKLSQLTKDHTLAQALVEAGIGGPDDAATKAMRHVLTAALGSTGERTDPQVQRMHLNDGDQLLLCTDGLTDMVADDVIASALKDAPSSEAACQGLIDLALAGGGKDNITVVLARYNFPQVGAE